MEISEGFSTLSVAYNFFRDNINCWKLNKKELMMITEIEKDDNSWLDEFDNDWDEKQRLFEIEMKKKIKHCCDLLDRILLREGIVFSESDDTIQEFVQVHNS